MTDQNMILFPHTGVKREFLEALLKTFGSLTLCQPWFTEPVVLSNALEKEALKVCPPPEVLKPREDFKTLLAEHQGWMMENQGKTRPTAFAGGETGDETWAIRKAIRDAEKEPIDFARKNTLKWHLMLHLARSLEDDRASAEVLLQRATQSNSPLAEAMEGEEETPDIFEDLPVSAGYPYVTDRHLNLIFEAWLGLFGNRLHKKTTLLTLDRQVMNHAVNLFDGQEIHPPGDTDPISPPHVDASGLKITRTALPRLSNPSSSKNPVLAGLSGKTIVLVERKQM